MLSFLETRLDRLLFDKEARCNISNICPPGSFENLLDKVYKWTHDYQRHDSPSIMWLAGAPRSGKSTIVSTVQCHFEDHAVSFCCYPKTDPSQILRTLCRYTADIDDGWRDTLLSIIAKERVARLNSRWVDEQIEVLLAPLVRSITVDGPLLWIIDGIDCIGDKADALETVSRFLDVLSLTRSKLRILVTSQIDTNIYDTLINKPRLRCEFLHEYDEPSMRGYIAQYIGGRLDHCAVTRGRHELRRWRKLEPLFTARSSESYVWARTACNALCQIPKYSEQLSDILTSSDLNELCLRLLGIEFPGDKCDDGSEALWACRLAMALVLNCEISPRSADTAVNDTRLVVLKFADALRIDRDSKYTQFPDFTDDDTGFQSYHTSASSLIKEEIKKKLHGWSLADLNTSGAGPLDAVYRLLLQTTCGVETRVQLEAVQSALSFVFDMHLLQRSITLRRNFWQAPILEDAHHGDGSSATGRSLLNLIVSLKNISPLLVDDFCEYIHSADRSGVYHVPMPLKHSTEVFDSLEHGIAFYSDDYIARNLSNNSSVCVWDGAESKPFTGHTRPVTSVAFSPDGMRIVSGSHDYSLRIWDVQTGDLVGKPLAGHTDWVKSVACSPDDALIVSGSDDTTVRIWDAHTGSQVRVLERHEKLVSSVAFSPEGTRIVSGSANQTIRIWDARTGVLVRTLIGHQDWVRSVAFSPNGLLIVSGSDDKTVRIWDAQTGFQILVFEGHENWVVSVAFSPVSTRLVSGSWDNTIRVWDAHTGAPIGEPLKGHTGSVRSVAFSPNGRLIVSGSGDRTVRIWDAHTGSLIGKPLKGHTDHVLSVAFSPDGSKIASGSFDGTVRIWSAARGTIVADISPLEDVVESDEVSQRSSSTVHHQHRKLEPGDHANNGAGASGTCDVQLDHWDPI